MRTEATQCRWACVAWAKGPQHEMVQWFISSFRRLTAGTGFQCLSESHKQGCFHG